MAAAQLLPPTAAPASPMRQQHHYEDVAAALGALLVERGGARPDGARLAGCAPLPLSELAPAPDACGLRPVTAAIGATNGSRRRARARYPVEEGGLAYDDPVYATGAVGTPAVLAVRTGSAAPRRAAPRARPPSPPAPTPPRPRHARPTAQAAAQREGGRGRVRGATG